MEAAEPNNDGQQDVQRPVLLQCLPRAIQSCLGRILSENALKGHLIAYWFYMMAQIVSDSNENHSPCLLLFTLGAGVSITLALMATSAQSAGLLFPVSVMSVLEWLRLQFYWLVVTAHRCRISFLDGNWVPIPLNDRWDHITQVLYLCLAFYFVLIFLTVLTMMTKYSNDALQRELNEPAFVIPHQIPGFIIPLQRREFVDCDEDDPPNYSLVIREPPEHVQTAKEETSPPRYTQLSKLERRSVG